VRPHLNFPIADAIVHGHVLIVDVADKTSWRFSDMKMGFVVDSGADARGAVQGSLANGAFKARTAMVFARLK